MAIHADPAFAPRRRVCRGGFTLIEILVTIGIIVLLASLLLPMAMRARRSAVKMKMQSTLQTLSTGLEAYQQAWGAYPVFDNAITGFVNDNDWNGTAADTIHRLYIDCGPRALYSGLVGRYALRVGSQSYGPFVNIDNLKIDRTNYWITDDAGKPILYVPAMTPRPDITKMVGPVGAQVPGFCADSLTATAAHGPVVPLYDHRAAIHTRITPGIGTIVPSATLISPEHMRILLGDTDKNGMINSTEKPMTTAPYLLWTAGQDGVFGLNTDPTQPTTDDVANFEFGAQYQRH